MLAGGVICQTTGALPAVVLISKRKADGVTECHSAYRRGRPRSGRKSNSSCTASLRRRHHGGPANSNGSWPSASSFAARDLRARGTVAQSTTRRQYSDAQE
jgi:hypothetical protein